MGVNVRNNRKSLVTLSRKNPNAKTLGDMHNTLRLLPGDNDVDPAQLDFLRGHPGNEELFDSETGCLQVMDGKAKPLPTRATPKERAAAAGRRADELSGIDPKQCKDIISATDDVPLLERWLEDDRKEVRGLVRKRIRELKKADA